MKDTSDACRRHRLSCRPLIRLHRMKKTCFAWTDWSSFLNGRASVAIGPAAACCCCWRWTMSCCCAVASYRICRFCRHFRICLNTYYSMPWNFWMAPECPLPRHLPCCLTYFLTYFLLTAWSFRYFLPDGLKHRCADYTGFSPACHCLPGSHTRHKGWGGCRGHNILRHRDSGRDRVDGTWVVPSNHNVLRTWPRRRIQWLRPSPNRHMDCNTFRNRKLQDTDNIPFRAMADNNIRFHR